MEIAREELEQVTVLRIRGRMDASHAQHLSSELSDLVREGRDQIEIDLSELAYISSAGIGALVAWHKRLGELRGYLTVTAASEPVRSMFRMMWIEDHLMGRPESQRTAEPEEEVREEEDRQARFEIHERDPDATLTCECLGEPSLLPTASYDGTRCGPVEFPATTFGLGVGAFGEDFEDCRTRFGEFLSVCGAAAYLPSDGATDPDYMVSAGDLVPSLQVLSGIRCTGDFSHLLRFAPKEAHGVVDLSDLAQECLALTKSEAAGIVVVGETAGLVGAALRQAPTARPAGGSIFAHPEIRHWLTFTPERALANSLCIVAGLAANTEALPVASYLRPLSNSSPVLGHFHALALSYSHLQHGVLDLEKTVRELFESQSLRGLLHLVNDERPIVGAGESEFTRGACWCAPITSSSDEGQRP